MNQTLPSSVRVFERLCDRANSGGTVGALVIPRAVTYKIVCKFVPQSERPVGEEQHSLLA